MEPAAIVPARLRIIDGSVQQATVVAVQQQQPAKPSPPTTVNDPSSTINRGSTEQHFNWPAGKSSYGNRRMPAESMESVLHHNHHNYQPAEGSGAIVDREAAGLSSNHQLHQQSQSSGNDQADQPRRRRYKTEYKKKFRPFSLYHYVDGRFQKPEKGADAAGGGSATMSSGAHPGPENNSSSHDTWYREVIELRKKAGEYKYRGLGGELMSQHMAELYAKQYEVWEQVSRRSSLSALALAAATPRSSSENNNKGGASSSSSKRGSPAKSAAAASAGTRPGHAQPVARDNNNGRSSSSKPEATSADRPRRERTTASQRSVSVEGKARAKSAVRRIKSPSHGPPPVSANNVAFNIVRPSLGAIFHPANRTPGRSASVGPERRMPKSSSSTSNHSVGSSSTAVSKGRSAAAHNNNDNGTAAPVKVPRHTTADGEGKENVIHPAAVHQDNGPSSLPANLNNEQPVVLSSLPTTLIKALAEPTRVKSPETSVVRSPDPVNWTVPLDTGKCFTVTQNIRGGDGSRPHSELKFNMIVRPPITSAPPVVPNSSMMESVSSKKDPGAPAPAGQSGSPAPAPGSPPHDSLGYFSEPEVIRVECYSPASEVSSEM